MKHRHHKAALLLAGAAFLSNYAAAEDNSLQAVKDRGELRVAVFSDKPPFGYVDREGHSQGYDIELAKALGKALFGTDGKVTFVLTEAQNRINVLDANKVDVTLANFTVTPERSAQVDFGHPYMKTAIGIVSPKNAPVTDVAALDGNVLIVNKGTTSESYFTQHHPKVTLQKYDHNSEAFAALKDGRAKALAHDNILLYAWAKNNPEFDVSIQVIGNEDVIAPAVKKGNTALLNWINDEIKTLQSQEFFHQAYDKTMKPFYGDNINPDNIVIDASNQ
ncbi:transporter substrate-binding domain-containing protein [Wohlfahrtiimonas chitiniclastica]|uniref:transporter substrate-binding domain-containing protein n=1 Tax=Wohlfahrtiimonas chitiniclastica TaxID=400946 RepID=UPI001BCB3E55|nr:transporter substrate-binding domain-containing protein [Wohlfahrtiimonas chitiniclastica]MBS7816830.1 transporter substrate-binding domain-containing protein [Wohlfahrtiimonas chitiniclastica]MBS7822277.1 transporter substrate-binding domain-containing protein [Wohlfahrtiimonas chitiniclastica]MBS7830339.1 transporter substrate-binding domain-containing protein [Wohlfahrtiimonas chitiniclastica]MBS7832307.1 transporter substrate-binding domain-containing protein [Wohlfahrtiimonas chitinicla